MRARRRGIEAPRRRQAQHYNDGCLTDSRLPSRSRSAFAGAAPLCADRHLVAHYVVDRFARRIDVLANESATSSSGRSSISSAPRSRARDSLAERLPPSERLRVPARPPSRAGARARRPARALESRESRPRRALARCRSAGPIGRRPLGPVGTDSVTTAPTAAP
jgi:hypothetical protein